jgi:predicted Zn-dependent protease
MVGDDLAKRFGSAAREWAAQIAGHYRRSLSSEGREKCARFSALAGLAALEAFAFEDAADHLEHALEAREDASAGEETAELAGRLGEAQLEIPWIRGSWELWTEARRNIIRAADHYLDTGNAESLAELIDRTEWVWRDPEMTPVMQRALRALPRGAALPALALHGFADAGGLRIVRQHYLRQLRRARRRRDPQAQFKTLGRLALTELHSNRLHRAWRYVQRIEKDPVYGGSGWLRAVRTLGRGASAAALTLAGRIGVQYPAETGLLDRALEESRLFEEQMARIGWSAGSYYALALRSSLLRLAGRFEEARSTAERAIEEQPMRSRIALSLALVECQTGEAERAARVAGDYLRRIDDAGIEEPEPDTIAELAALYSATTAANLARGARNLASRMRGRGPMGPNREDVARTALALLAAADGDASEAARYLAQLGSARPMMRSMVISTDRLRGLLALTSGRVWRGVRSLKKALRFSRGVYPPEAAWVSFELARALLARGLGRDRRRAAARLAHARAAATDLGMRALLSRVEEVEAGLGHSGEGRKGS